VTDDAERLDRLERALEQLAFELAALKAERTAGFGAAPRPTPPPIPRPVAPPPAVALPRIPTSAPPPPTKKSAFGDLSIESLIGRYGVLALAALTIIMGAGALVSWALRNGLLGPEIRVALAALLALGLAAVGLRARVRGATRFAEVLLALALAVTHVVFWGAGPELGLIPPWASLGFAAAASLGLAILALRDDSQSLFDAGFGGALIAPFVMSKGAGDLRILAVYGVVVIGAGIRALGDRAWKTAITLLFVSTAFYVMAAQGYRGDSAMLTRQLPVLVAGIIAVCALIFGAGAARRWLSLAGLGMMSLMLGGRVTGTLLEASLSNLVRYHDIVLAAIAGTALVFVAARTLDDDERFVPWLAAVLLVPMLFLSAVMNLLGAPVERLGVVAGAIVLFWATTYAAAALTEPHGRRRGVLLGASGAVSLWALTTALAGLPDAVPPAAALHALVFAWVAKSEDEPIVLIASALSLLVGYGLALDHLAVPSGYTSAPFLAAASLGALTVIAASHFVAKLGRVQLERALDGRAPVDGIGTLVAFALAFFWGRVELEHAFSRDASTFLSISYHAASGVLAIWFGRARDEIRLRQLGLGLCVFAALMAVGQAWDVQQIGLRVGSYLGVGGFLLGVAWWYRKSSDA
jgi:uncharacterized membrane protein